MGLYGSSFSACKHCLVPLTNLFTDFLTSQRQKMSLHSPCSSRPLLPSSPQPENISGPLGWADVSFPHLASPNLQGTSGNGIFLSPASRIPFLLGTESWDWEGARGQYGDEGTGRCPCRGCASAASRHIFLPHVLVFLFKQVVIIFSMESGKLRHSSFLKTPSKSADREGFPDSHR